MRTSVCAVWVAVACVALLAAAPARALPPAVWTSSPPGVPGPEYSVLRALPGDVEKPWWQWARMGGDWGGWRDRWKEAGVEILADYITEIAGNVSGGQSRGVTYTHNVGVWLNFDLEKLVGWKGGRLHASASDRVGTSLSQRRIGNQLAVQQIFGGQTIRLVSLALEQSLFEKKLDVIAGRIDWGDDFLQSPLYCQFQNVGFCGNAVSVPIDANLSTYPNTSWGLRIRTHWLDTFHSKIGVYNTVHDFRDNRWHGVDFSMRHDSGVAVAWELAWLPVFGGAADPLAGHYKLGGYVDTEPLLQFESGLMRSGTYGLYAAFDQKLFHEPGSSAGEQGLTSFIALTYAPPELARVELYLMGGLVYEGLVPGRDQDIAALGWIYADFSSDLRQSQRAAGLPAQEYEIIVEGSYELSPVPWLQIQPDVQYVIRPGGTGEIDDALVFALQINVPI